MGYWVLPIHALDQGLSRVALVRLLSKVKTIKFHDYIMKSMFEIFTFALNFYGHLFLDNKHGSIEKVVFMLDKLRLVNSKLTHF